MLSNVPDRDTARSSGDCGLAAPITIAVESLADGTCLVSVWGEVDLSTAPQLERVLDDATHAGNEDVLVEFSQDSFIDSTGLNVLIRAAKRLAAASRSLRVTTENAHMRGVIETMGLGERLGMLGPPVGPLNRPG
jgi:anti-sigma B factor antagonist